MIILGLDTSTRAASVALWSDGDLLGELVINDKRTHSQKLMPMLENLFQLANISIDDVDLLAVCIGPGSFTGIRIAMATVKALGHVRNLPIVGVNSLESLAYNLSDGKARLVPILDAQGSQVYSAIYESSGQAPEILRDIGVVDIDNLIEEVRGLDGKIIFLGEGINKYRDRLKDLRPNINLASSNTNVSRAASVCACASHKYKKGQDIHTCYDILPMYIRKSQAEVQYEEKQRAMKNDL